MCCTRLAGNAGPQIAKILPFVQNRTTLVGYIFTTNAYIDSWKKLLNSNIYYTCLHKMVNFGPLEAEIVSLVWGTPANSNGFRVLVSLLQRRRWTEANHTLHDVWPSPGLVHCIYIFGGSCTVTEFCQVQHSLCVQVLRSPILAALLHGTLVVGVNQTLRALNRGRHRYSAGRLPRWALAHILVMVALCNRAVHYIFVLWFVLLLLLSFFFFLA